MILSTVTRPGLFHSFLHYSLGIVIITAWSYWPLSQPSCNGPGLPLVMILEFHDLALVPLPTCLS